MSRVSARRARPPSSSTTYGHLLLESNDTTILPARCRGGRITSPQRAARTNTAFPRDSLRRRGSRGEPSIASLPGIARELLPVGRRARPPRLRERGGGGGAGKGGTAAPSCGDSPPAPPAALRGPPAPHRPAGSLSPASTLTSVPAHAQARPAARPSPHIAAGRGGSAPVTARSQWPAPPHLPARPAPRLEGGAAGRLP